MEQQGFEIHRHKTAIRRVSISLPVKCTLRDGLLSEMTSLFDYGCGRGHDIELLGDLNISCDGWDPVHRPAIEPRPADIVNLGYVINVIEDKQERSESLLKAWRLAQRVLVVSAQLEGTAKTAAYQEFADGVVSSRGTFQKYYSQAELRTYVDDTLGVESVPAAPGIFYAFKDEIERQEHLARRYRRTSAIPHRRISDVLFDQNKEILEPFMERASQLGRLPEANEIEHATEIISRLGSLKKAFALVRRITDTSSWDTIRETRTEDLLVYLALSRFGRRPILSQLPKGTQYDVRSFFGTYSKACREADSLLFAVGNPDLIDDACKRATVGQLSENALLVRRDALDRLNPILRAYEGCARALIGEIDGADIVKLHRFSGKVSYLGYRDFDSLDNPELLFRFKVGLRTLSIDTFDYTAWPEKYTLESKNGLCAKDAAGDRH